MIEPFGLLNFIQSALNSAATPPQTERQDAAPQSTSAPSTSPSLQTRDVEPKKEETVLPSVEPQKNNPFLNFCEEHDRRAKRVKRNP